VVHKLNLCHGQNAGAQTEAAAFGPEMFAVTGSAVDVAVRTVVQVGRVQRSVAVAAHEAPLVPYLKIDTKRKRT